MEPAMQRSRAKDRSDHAVTGEEIVPGVPAVARRAAEVVTGSERIRDEG
jgi:hypothetical protein